MLAIVARWGDSLALRIPGRLASSLQREEGSTVELREHRGALVVTPARARHTLDELLAKATPGNGHKETSWGKPVGKEVW